MELAPIFMKIGAHSMSCDVTDELLADEVAFSFVMLKSLRNLREAHLANPTPTKVTIDYGTGEATLWAGTADIDKG